MTVTLDWSTAEVEDGRLTVELSGELPDGWKQSFRHTAALLGGTPGDWSAIELGKQKVRVNAVLPGAEERLRHFLESAVTQANASTEPEDFEHNDEHDDDDSQAGEEDGDHSDHEGPDDAELTARFRAFAER